MSLYANDSIYNGFNLLCLQDDEYFFSEYATQLSITSSTTDTTTLENTTAASSTSTQTTTQDGHIKLCSQSIYFIPSSNPDVITRISLQDITVVVENSTPSILTLTATQHTIIHQNQPAKPYEYIKIHHTFSFLDPDDVFYQLFTRLLDVVHSGKKQSSIHFDSAVSEIIRNHELSIKFNANILPEEERKNKILCQVHGCRITPLASVAGWVALTHKAIYFQPFFSSSSVSNNSHQQQDNNEITTDASTLRFPLSEVLDISQRAFRLQQTALEIFFNKQRPTTTMTTMTSSSKYSTIKLNHPSLFLAFATFAEMKTFKVLLQQHTSPSSGQNMQSYSMKHYTKEWIANKISNYEYLMHVNDFAGRSFNDLTQYPVFPWILSDYSSTELDLNNPAIYRDLSKPIGALNPSRLQQAREMYAALSTAGSTDPPWMYGSHYSNPGIVVFYLVRANPHLMLRLQNGKFDSADRFFTSVAGAWKSVLRWNSDIKELIPEFYHIHDDNNNGNDGDVISENDAAPIHTNKNKDIKFLVNWSGTDLGIKTDGVTVDDVELPPWSKNDPILFVKTMRVALESPHVSANLHKWIDLVFGYASRGKAAVLNDNLFNFMTYDEIALEYLKKNKDAAICKAYEAQVREYGRTPKQLFARRHPRKKGVKIHSSRGIFSCACLSMTTSLNDDEKAKKVN